MCKTQFRGKEYIKIADIVTLKKDLVTLYLQQLYIPAPHSDTQLDTTYMKNLTSDTGFCLLDGKKHHKLDLNLS